LVVDLKALSLILLQMSIIYITQLSIINLEKYIHIWHICHICNIYLEGCRCDAALLARYHEITKPEGCPKEAKCDTRHYIKTTRGPPMIYRPRRLAPKRLAAARREFEKMIELGIVRPSKSCWSSPLHMALKKGDEWNYGDYRALKARTIPNFYPVRRIQNFARVFQGKKLFTTINLVRAYHQIPVAEEDIPKTTITTPFGIFEFPTMSFGLRNAAQTFQRFIDEVIRDLDFCCAYVDDILVASSSIEEHLEHLRCSRSNRVKILIRYWTYV